MKTNDNNNKPFGTRKMSKSLILKFLALDLENMYIPTYKA